MFDCHIYLDESGDLGFKFGAPYRAGGSSRYLTLAAVVRAADSNKYIKRAVKHFYKARQVPPGSEVKWAELGGVDRSAFADAAVKLAAQRRTVTYAVISAFKPKVLSHSQADPNKLYNYMAGLLLLPCMKKYGRVCFIPDARSVKVKSGNSLGDYLQTKLWFDEDASTVLTTQPMESTKSLGLHFADYLCGAFQSHFEDSASAPMGKLSPTTACTRLFFP